MPDDHRQKCPRPRRLDQRKLHDPALQKLFQADIISTTDRPSPPSSTNKQYHHFVDDVNELAQKHFAEDASVRPQKNG